LQSFAAVNFVKKISGPLCTCARIFISRSIGWLVMFL